jgi:2,3-bisphosphoglycerate-dependent phosphoglycerate mutase
VSSWPRSLWVVRHGESVGNVANADAAATGAPRLDIDVNDIDVELSDLGVDQARALGRWLGRAPAEQQPTAVVVSPYRRARQTAETALQEAGLGHVSWSVDERLRDREQGVLDRLTATGIRAEYPEEADRRAYLGKFWFRPAGGESWADVALRVRAFLTDLRLDAADERVLVVMHDVPILLLRYAIERLSVEEVVGLSGQVRNCSVTKYRAGGAGMDLEVFNDTSALDQENETHTAHE